MTHAAVQGFDIDGPHLSNCFNQLLRSTAIYADTQRREVFCALLKRAISKFPESVLPGEGRFAFSGAGFCIL
eukprot:1159933-Pelagomonas_calceolata.AAC.1